MDSITNIIPTPRPLPVAAAGVTIMVGEFTLRDLADLQAVLDGRHADPLMEIGEALAELSSPASRGDSHAAQQGADARRLALLRTAWRAADAGAAIYGEPSGRDYFEGTEGAALLTWVACRRYNADITPARAAELVAAMTPWEFSRLFRIAHGQDGRRILERMIYPLPKADEAARAGAGANSRLTWAQAIEEVVADHPGWRYADVYDLTLTEFSNARRNGKPVSDDYPLPPGADPVAMLAEMRLAFYGEDNLSPGELSPADHAAQGDGDGDSYRPDEPMGEAG